MKKKILTIGVICILIVQFCTGCDPVDTMQSTVQENEITGSEDEVPSFSVGSVKNNIYTNEFFGFEFRPDSEYLFAESYLLQSSHNAGLSTDDPGILNDFEDDTVGEIIKAGYTVNIMNCKGAGAIRNVSVDVIYDKVTAANMRVGHNNILTMMESPIKESLVAKGYEENSIFYGEATFKDDIVVTMDVMATNNRIPYYIRHVFVEKENYIAVIRVISQTDFEDTQDVLDYFSQCGEETQETSKKDSFDTMPIVGYIEDNVYTNTVLNIQCRLSDEWEYWPIDMLENYNGISFDTESIGTIVEEGQSFYPMAADTESGENINLMVRCERGLLEYMPVEEILKVNEEELRLQYTEVYSQWGYSDITFEISTVDFLDETLPCYEMNAKTPLGTVCQKQVMYLCGDYYIIVTVTHNSQEEVQAMFDCFSFLE